MSAPRASAPPGHVLSWHAVGASSSLKPGGIIPLRLPGEEIVLCRGASGRAFALDAHCSHMGTHLSHGRVAGDALRCPLHHWTYGPRGARLHPPPQPPPGPQPDGACFAQRAFPVVERYGAIFVFNAVEALHPPPEFVHEGPRGVALLPGRPVELDCPWTAIVANGYDRNHFETVHGRALLEEPELTRPHPHCLRLRYTSRVTGRSAADRAMKRLARDRINVTVTCWGGTVVLVESDLGRTRSALILSVTPLERGTRVAPLFGVHRSPAPWFDAARLRVAAWLFGGFLRRDAAIMDGMRFSPRLADPGDAALGECLRFLDSLPRGNPTPSPYSGGVNALA